MNQMKGKVVLITGSNEGIGKQTAYELASMGATVLLHAKDFLRGSAVLNCLRKKLPAAAFDLFIADFGRRHEIEQMATDIKAAYRKVDVLVNNESVFMDERKLTADTIEQTFSINHLAPFFLTHLLLPLLRNAAGARIINVCSHAHYIAKFDIRNLQGEKAFDGTTSYCLSKLCNLLFTYALAEKLDPQQISVNAVHPGSFAVSARKNLFGQPAGQTDEDGADTIVYLASSDEVYAASGMYFSTRMPVQSSYASYNKKFQDKLWKLSEHLAIINGYTTSIDKFSFSRPVRPQNFFREKAGRIVSRIRSWLADESPTSKYYYQDNRG